MKRVCIIVAVLLYCFSFFGDVQAKGSTSIRFSVNALPRTDEVEMQVKVSNLSDQPKKLRFASSQKYEIVIKSENGEEVFRYSLHKDFLQAIQNKTINPHETYVWKEIWDYKCEGEKVEPGDYSIEAAFIPMLNNPKDSIKAFSTVAVPEENMVYKNIKVIGTKGVYTVTGIANTANKLLYTVEDGHYELLSNQVVEKSADGYFRIHIKIPKADLPMNGTLILYIIEQAENYTKPFPVKLEVFPS
ncbi:BsuPI-related putative proteinase inhibitor [Niallia sp. 01092]|uniref:BsuPI-related putative proteinase inhibitor n=1 Tax=unclassified Niallia TaxID=2837522 RepID=UPI003FD0E70A